MSEVYRIFAVHWESISDFSDEALLNLYYSESYGDKISPNNGYALGKKWLSVTVAMWKEDIKSGMLFKHELYKDNTFPHWWLDSVLKSF